MAVCMGTSDVVVVGAVVVVVVVVGAVVVEVVRAVVVVVDVLGLPEPQAASATAAARVTKPTAANLRTPRTFAAYTATLPVPWFRRCRVIVSAGGISSGSHRRSVTSNTLCPGQRKQPLFLNHAKDFGNNGPGAVNEARSGPAPAPKRTTLKDAFCAA